ncbi:hypothetical protein CQY20_08140 [Mycolicibacterium agri]|jgi:hypothetical protein|uniref:Uncharacterized protein n=1 Tax=Mycolicibacterium agri TaxID=36811 RepID=A0A2A7N814_MYCAG|nr:hypothetical protein [Mycolicibacterium agri]PEG40205.1 hypothetical protein CQY20_08140 [Mycolicibacterium agri]GFG55743.1 hypothetical protein MAGR_71840 [Mycolicibacterium agri]
MRRVWVIVTLWGLLVVQYAADTFATSAGREAFPTVTMPTFSAASIGDDGSARVVERTVQVIGRDGTVKPVGVAALLAPLHSGPASLTLDRLLKPSADGAEPSRETVDWLKHQTLRLAITSDPIGLRVVWQPAVVDLRAMTRTPAGPPTVREVWW